MRLSLQGDREAAAGEEQQDSQAWPSQDLWCRAGASEDTEGVKEDALAEN
jgi:hypothetical protein